MTPETTLVQWLREARRVLVFCGAGISAESGIPTFRGAGGLWEGHRIEDVATPEGFARDPVLVWQFYAARQHALPTVSPNPAHEMLAAMERHYPAFLLVTQNVDDLHERAGSRDAIHLHGSLDEVRCTLCGRQRPLGSPPSLADVRRGVLPHCACGGLERPGVVWFGEMLNPTHLRSIEKFIETGWNDGPAFLVLVIGTSGVVGGDYGIHSLPAALGARVVEINPEETLLSSEVDLAVRAPAGALLGRVWPEVGSAEHPAAR